MKFNCPFVLASSSPRRKHLLTQMGITFDIKVSDVDEIFDPEDTPEAIVQDLAARKATPISRRFPDALTLAADTLVVMNDRILGKPEDEQDAYRMLRLLSGQTHSVYTGIALAHPASDRYQVAYERTQVLISPMSDAEILGYIATGSPMDKAGAYGIQDDRGAFFVERIQGDYYNVVGLPLHRLYTVLKNSFSDLLA